MNPECGCCETPSDHRVLLADPGRWASAGRDPVRGGDGVQGREPGAARHGLLHRPQVPVRHGRATGECLLPCPWDSSPLPSGMCSGARGAQPRGAGMGTRGWSARRSSGFSACEQRLAPVLRGELYLLVPGWKCWNRAGVGLWAIPASVLSRRDSRAAARAARLAG